MADIWITGAKGFIGRHAARACADRGHRVYAIGHGSWLDADSQMWGVSTWINSSLTTAGLDALASHGRLPDVIIHLAGGSSVAGSIAAPREDFERTVVASAELLEWVRTRSPHSRIVTASSAAVYGDAWDDPIPVDAALRPCSPYGAHKSAMETLLAGHARSFGLRIAIVRLFSVYGPGLEKQLLWDLCTQMARAAPTIVLGGTGDESRDFVYVTDAAQMLVNAADVASADCPILNGGHGSGISVSRLARLAISMWPANHELVFDGRVRRGDPRHMIADVSGSHVIAPAQGIPFEEGVEKTVSAARRRLLVD